MSRTRNVSEDLVSGKWVVMVTSQAGKSLDSYDSEKFESEVWALIKQMFDNEEGDIFVVVTPTNPECKDAERVGSSNIAPTTARIRARITGTPLVCRVQSVYDSESNTAFRAMTYAARIHVPHHLQPSVRTFLQGKEILKKKKE